MNIIRIQALEITCHIGVPDEEISSPQKVQMDIEMQTLTEFHHMQDSITRTIDYADVAFTIKKLASEKPRRLVETLAADCIKKLIRTYPLKKVKIVVRKFILPDTRCVEVETHWP